MPGDPRAVGLARLLASRPDVVARLRSQQAERSATDKERIAREAALAPDQSGAGELGAGNPGTQGAGYQANPLGLGDLGQTALTTGIGLAASMAGLPMNPTLPFSLTHGFARAMNYLGLIDDYVPFQEPMPEVYEDPRTLNMIDPSRQPLNVPVPSLTSFTMSAPTRSAFEAQRMGERDLSFQFPEATPITGVVPSQEPDPEADPNTALTMGFVMNEQGEIGRGLANRTNFGRRGEEEEAPPAPDPEADPDPGNVSGFGAPTGEEGNQGDPGGNADFGGGGTVRDRMRLPRGLERISAHEGEEVIQRDAAARRRPLLKAINRGEPKAGLMRLLRSA